MGSSKADRRDSPEDQREAAAAVFASVIQSAVSEIEAAADRDVVSFEAGLCLHATPGLGGELRRGWCLQHDVKVVESVMASRHALGCIVVNPYT